MRARACIKCREFVLIKPESPQNMEILKLFEKKHQLHTIITIDYNEIKGSFSKFVINQKENNPVTEANEYNTEKEIKETI